MTRKTSFKLLSYISLTIVVVVLCPARTLGWGNKGHQIIARIAMARLSNSTRQAIDELLAGQTLERISTWADQIKTQRAETRSWHFIAIPLTDNRYSPLKDCGRGETCIIDAIGQQIAVLKDTTRDATERAEALKFLVNLIGDLHQPFRVTTNTNPQDRSATQVRVTLQSGRSTNLLDAWDNDLVEQGSRQAKSVADYATLLSKRFSRGASSKANQGSFVSTQGSVTDWALEAHRLAWTGYYHTNGDFMVNDQMRSWTLDQPYYDKNVPLVEGQLVRAGFRLARILNDIFSTSTKY
jgi:hypothetical protein